MNRRTSLHYLCLGGALTLAPTGLISASPARKGPLNYVYPKVSSPYPTALPDNLRVPFQWQYFSVAKGEEPVRLTGLKRLDTSASDARLRLTTALDSREEKVVEVRIPGEDAPLGILDCKYSPLLQIIELAISPEHLPLIHEKGLELRLVKGETPIYFFADVRDKADHNGVLFPHLLTVSPPLPDPTSQFIDQFMSSGSLQPFDWMGGCVLDGLWQLYQQKGMKQARKALDTYLSMFFDKQDNLVQENPKSEIADNHIHSIESTLAFAVVARLYPEHPVLKIVEAFWQETLRDDGAVAHSSITAEGSYTIAYPMAVLAKEWQRDDLARLALQQLRHRMVLHHDGAQYLRYHQQGNRTFRNWARGLAWYMLGLARTLPLLHDIEDTRDLVEELERVTDFVLSYQQENGLWRCFLDAAATDVDTSGSAGMAAAIATGIHTGFLPETLKPRVEKTWQGLLPYLTPDGLLDGVAQSNRGGEALQRSDYRVISQMGMGLMAQLYAYL
ncbi:MAG: glycoside hydrolase family 88 protein [Cyclobacteriaceae bacterium]